MLVLSRMEMPVDVNNMLYVHAPEEQDRVFFGDSGVPGLFAATPGDTPSWESGGRVCYHHGEVLGPAGAVQPPPYRACDRCRHGVHTDHLKPQTMYNIIFHYQHWLNARDTRGRVWLLKSAWPMMHVSAWHHQP